MEIPRAADVQWLHSFHLLSYASSLLGHSMMIYAIYTNGDRNGHRISQYLPVTAFLYQLFCGIMVLAPNRLITAAAVPLWRLLSTRYFNGWTVAVVFVSTASVSLGMLGRCAGLDTVSNSTSKSSASAIRWSAAADTILESPAYRLLYIFHFSTLPFNQTSQFRQALLDLCGSIMFAGVLAYAIPWDKSKYSVAQRAVCTTVSILGFVSTALLDWRFVTTLKALEQNAE